MTHTRTRDEHDERAELASLRAELAALRHRIERIETGNDERDRAYQARHESSVLGRWHHALLHQLALTCDGFPRPVSADDIAEAMGITRQWARSRGRQLQRAGLASITTGPDRCLRYQLTGRTVDYPELGRDPIT